MSVFNEEPSKSEEEKEPPMSTLPETDAPPSEVCDKEPPLLQAAAVESATAEEAMSTQQSLSEIVAEEVEVEAPIAKTEEENKGTVDVENARKETKTKAKGIFLSLFMLIR